MFLVLKKLFKTSALSKPGASSRRYSSIFHFKTSRSLATYHLRVCVTEVDVTGHGSQQVQGDLLPVVSGHLRVMRVTAQVAIVTRALLCHDVIDVVVHQMAPHVTSVLWRDAATYKHL